MNKHRNKSPRAQWWNYAWAGAYFITICTKERTRYFGEIKNGIMDLSDIGRLAEKFWFEIPDHAKNIELGSFVVMPDHIHGILILGTPFVGARHVLPLPPIHALPLPNHTPPLPIQGGPDPWNRYQNQGKNTVSSIIGSYKSAVTRHARILDPSFGWQSLYYDRIIRNDHQFHILSRYIELNPKNWEDDQHQDDLLLK